MAEATFYPFQQKHHPNIQGEDINRSMEWLTRRIIKAAARISYHGRRSLVHVASSFPLAHHYRAVLGAG